MIEENSGPEALDTPQEVEVQETETAEPTEPKEGEEPRKRTGAEKLKFKLERERAEKAELQRQLDEARKPTPKAEDAPKLEDYEDYTEFNRAMARYEVKQALKENEETSKQQKLREQRESQQKGFDARAQEFAKTTPDYVEAVDDLMDSGVVTPMLSQAVVESELGPQLAYYFAQNPEEAAKVSKMGYGEMNRYLGKLETRFESKPAAKTTNAPPPITPARGSTGTAGKDPYTNPDMSPEEYKAWKAKQKR